MIFDLLIKTYLLGISEGGACSVQGEPVFLARFGKLKTVAR